MTEVIDARFKAGGKAYTFNPNGLQLKPGDMVILSTTRGEEIGECVRGNYMIDEMELTAPLRPVLRPATEADIVPRAEMKEKERAAMKVCKEKVAAYGLDMKLVACSCAADESKILFYFTADERVDFRALVKDLASTLHARIELRQIGVRDETKMLGGLGICGQPFCCSRFLDKFQPVSIKMAKTQNLSLNPTKISGSCGRLMCCLKYEQGAYEDAAKRVPKKESFVETPDGAGTVTDVNYLREKVKVRLEEAADAAPKQYLNQEVRVIRSGKGKRPEDYVAPPKEELEKLRYIPPEEERKLSAEPRSSLAEKLNEIFSAEPDRTAAPKKQGRSGNRRRSGGQKSGQEGKKDQPRQEPPQPKKDAQPKEGGGRSRNRSHRRRPRKPGGEGPKAE